MAFDRHHLRGRGEGGVAPDDVEHHVGTVAEEGLADAPPDATRAAGDQDDRSGEVQRVGSITNRGGAGVGGARHGGSSPQIEFNCGLDYVATRI